MYRYIKRLFDLVFSILILIAMSPVFLLVSLALIICHDGPVLFKQKRPGKGGKIFTVYKFRTMKTQTHKDGIELSDMERITGVGKVLRALSIDELPQLLNVLKGEMSFIGPRPLLVEYMTKYNERQQRRHEILPGITGWAQINGRNSISWSERFELDIWYVDNMSFWVDFKIVFKTFGNIIKKDGINTNANVTMERFMGSSDSMEKVHINTNLF